MAGAGAGWLPLPDPEPAELLPLEPVLEEPEAVEPEVPPELQLVDPPPVSVDAVDAAYRAAAFCAATCLVRRSVVRMDCSRCRTRERSCAIPRFSFASSARSCRCSSLADVEGAEGDAVASAAGTTGWASAHPVVPANARAATGAENATTDQLARRLRSVIGARTIVVGTVISGVVVSAVVGVARRTGRLIVKVRVGRSAAAGRAAAGVAGARIKRSR